MSVMVSICCITYNHEKFISDTIESFLMQETEYEYEIIIHDDASTDRTADIIRAYASKYPSKIVPILQSENQHSKGVRISSDYVYPAAKGQFIALCEGDDYWISKDKLQKQTEYMKTHPNTSLSFHSAHIYDEKSQRVERIYKPFNENCNVKMSDLIVGGGSFCPTASLMFRKEDAFRFPDFYKKCAIGDYPLQLFLASQGEIYFFANVLSCYRKNVIGSWTNTINSGNDKDLKVLDHNFNILEMLNGFDKFTNYQYTESVENRKHYIEFENLRIRNQLKEMKKPPYLEIYRAQGFLGRFKIHLQYYMPNVDLLLRNIKSILKCR